MQRENESLPKHDKSRENPPKPDGSRAGSWNLIQPEKKHVKPCNIADDIVRGLTLAALTGQVPRASSIEKFQVIDWFFCIFKCRLKLDFSLFFSSAGMLPAIEFSLEKIKVFDWKIDWNFDWNFEQNIKPETLTKLWLVIAKTLAG